LVVLLINVLIAILAHGAVDDGLIAHWTFDEGRGSTVNDHSEYGNHGTVDRATWTAGVSGDALSFNGESSSVRVLDSDSLDVTVGLTIAAWINAVAFFGEGDHNGNPIVTKWETTRNGVPIGQYHLSLYEGGNIIFRVAGDTELDELVAEQVVDVGGWSHIAASWDGRIMRLYVNGSVVAEKSSKVATIQNREYGGDDLKIGQDTGGWDPPGWYFHGAIDDVRIYGRALTADEVTDLHTIVERDAGMGPTMPSSLYDGLPPNGPLDLSTFVVHFGDDPTHPCTSWDNEVSPSRITLKCDHASAWWSAVALREVDVSDYSRMRLTGTITSSPAIERDYHSVLVVLPGRVTCEDGDRYSLCSLDGEPLQGVTDGVGWGRWDEAAIAYCNVRTNEADRECELDADVSGLDTVTIVYLFSDGWIIWSDLHGTLSDATIELVPEALDDKGSDWPMIQRNPARTGYTDDEVRPPLKLAWRYKTNEVVRSSPAVVNGTVYVGSFDNHVHAIDATTGESIWKYRTKDTIYSSPALSDGSLYIGSHDGYLYSLDAATGELNWKYQMGYFFNWDKVPGDDEGRFRDYFSGNRVVDWADRAKITKADDKMSITVTSDGDSITIYLNKERSEATITRKQPTGLSMWNFPVSVVNNETIVYYPNVAVTSSPVVYDDTVYINSVDYLYALDAGTGGLRWRYDSDHVLDEYPAIHDGLVFIPTTDGHVHAIDADTGVGMWKKRLGNSSITSVSVIRGIVYAGSKDHFIYALDAANGNQLWKFETGGKIHSAPAIDDERVFIGSDDGFVHALDASTGEERARYWIGIWVYSAPAVSGGTVYISSLDNSIYAVDIETEEQTWRYETGGRISSSPAVSNGMIYVGSDDEYLYAFRGCRPSEGCCSDADCEQDMTCTSRECLPRDCGELETCGNECVNPTAGRCCKDAWYPGAECCANDDCDAGTICVSGTCSRMSTFTPSTDSPWLLDVLDLGPFEIIDGAAEWTDGYLLVRGPGLLHSGSDEGLFLMHIDLVGDRLSARTIGPADGATAMALQHHRLLVHYDSGESAPFQRIHLVNGSYLLEHTDHHFGNLTSVTADGDRFVLCGPDALTIMRTGASEGVGHLLLDNGTAACSGYDWMVSVVHVGGRQVHVHNDTYHLPLWSSPELDDEPTSVLLHDGRVYAGTPRGRLMAWNLTRDLGERTLPGHTGPLQVLAADDRYIYSGGADGVIKVREAEILFGRFTLRGHTSPVLGIVPLDDRVLSFDNGTVRLWKRPYRPEPVVVTPTIRPNVTVAPNVTLVPNVTLQPSPTKPSGNLFKMVYGSCGDDVCDTDEDSGNCCRDCGCPPGQTCTDDGCIIEDRSISVVPSEEPKVVLEEPDDPMDYDATDVVKIVLVLGIGASALAASKRP
jgi:outer membrane protein assembly factor BamB